MKKKLHITIIFTIFILGCSYSKGNGSISIVGLIFNILKGNAPAENVTNISGTLTDTTGTVIANATLQVTKATASSISDNALSNSFSVNSAIQATSDVTNSAGEFLIAIDIGVSYTASVTSSTGVSLGGFTITASNSSTVSISNYTGTVRVGRATATTTTSAKCETDTANVTTKSIKGKVRDGTTTSAISGAIITTVPVTSTLLSEADGSFIISGISADTTSLTISVAANGYQSKSDTITLTCQNSSTIILLTQVASSPITSTPIGAGTGTGTGTPTSNNIWDTGLWDTMIWQ